MTEAFTWGSGGQRLTPSERRRRVAEAMLKAGSDTSPVQHWTQGAARVAQALMGGLQMRRENEAEAAAEASLSADRSAMGTPLAAAAAATPVAVAEAQTGSGDPQNALDAIMKYESAGKNVHQNIVPAGGGFNPSTGTVTGPSSASGYFQMINPTWRSAAKLAGVDTTQYPTAMSAPYEAQRKVAAALFAKEGFAPWAPYNAALRSHIAKRGGAGSFINDGAAPAQMADIPAAGAAPAAMETGQTGFAVPEAAPTMDANTFNAIQEGQPLLPVFQSEGASQPWMGTALGAPAAPQGAQVAQAPVPMPPPRPANLALPQADLPAPGAVPAVGQAVPPMAALDQSQVDPNSPDGGVGAFQRMEAARAAGANQSPFARVAAALEGPSAPAQAAAPSPAVQAVAQAAAAAPAAPAAVPSAGVDRVAAAVRVMNSPYAQPGDRAIAQQIVQQAYRDPAKVESDKLDLDLKRKQLSKSDEPTAIQEYNLAVKQGEKRSFTDWSTAKAKAGATSVNVNGGGSDKQIFDTFAENTKEARAAANGLVALREARGALAGGVITGAGADAKLALQKIGAAFGLGDVSKIENTETFRAAIAPQVSAVLKATVGSANISNSDREFAEKAAGGSIQLDERSINRLLDVMEKAGVARLEQHQKQLEAVYPDPEGNRRERALFGVAMPPAPAANPNTPVRVKTPEEARKLPSGTRIILPDGSEGRVP